MENSLVSVTKEKGIISLQNDGKILFESERLRFRNILESDADQIFIMDSDPEVLKYIYIPPANTLQDAIGYTRNVRQQYADHGTGRLAVIEKSTNSFIGWAGVKFHVEIIDGKSHFYDLGYRFLRSAWGKGYGSEAAKAVAEFAFLTLEVPMLAGSADVQHSASNRLLEKAGLLKSHEFWEDGQMWTWYEISREQWLEKFHKT